MQRKQLAETCAALSDVLDEPLAGTAAVAGTWMCLEQRGPWGHDAVVQSHLDSQLGALLSERAAANGIRLQLIRRPGRHPDDAGVRTRRVYIAHTRPGHSWLRQSDIDDPAQLLRLDFAQLAAGDHGEWGQPATQPVLLVCTNGRRDRCCAVWGRALLAELHGRHDDSIWETTHTGGHRFAPAAVVLPSGYTYGRLTAHTAEAVLSAATAGKVCTDLCRGRSTWSGQAQAAELALREHIGEYASEALTVEAPDALASSTDSAGSSETRFTEVRLAHRDGRRWVVTLEQQTLEPPRPNSCGKSATRPTGWRVCDIAASHGAFARLG